MFLGDKLVQKLVTEGIAPSRTIAAFHFENNRVTEAGKKAIYKIFRHPPSRDSTSHLLTIDEMEYSSETDNE
jgi:hypothetical protein